MLIRERMIASKIAARLRNQYPKIDVEVNIYTNVKMVIKFTTDPSYPRKIEVTLSDLDIYVDEDDMIADATILVKRNIKE